MSSIVSEHHNSSHLKENDLEINSNKSVKTQISFSFNNYDNTRYSCGHVKKEYSTLNRPRKFWDVARRGILGFFQKKSKKEGCFFNSRVIRGDRGTKRIRKKARFAVGGRPARGPRPTTRQNAFLDTPHGNAFYVGTILRSKFPGLG